MIARGWNMMVRYTLDPNKPYKMTAAEKKRLEETQIDYSDIPELDDDFFKNAKIVDWPLHESATHHIRLDADVLMPGSNQMLPRLSRQRINRILRVAMESQPKTRARKKTTASRS